MKCLLLYFELCTCVHAYACVCDHGQVLYGSNYWQRGPSDTHSASLSGPNGIYLPPPLPFLFLSLDFYLFLTLSFLLPLFFCTPLSLRGLNYFRMSPKLRGKVKPLSIFLLGTKSPDIF